MNFSQEKLGKAESEILEVMQKYDVQYAESALICVNILAFTARDSGFPFEKFQRMCNELISDYKKEWPIG